VYANLADAISFLAPAFAAQVAMAAWISRGRLIPIMSDLSQILCADAIIKSIATGLFKKQGHKFKVTAKGRSRDVKTVQWPLLRSFFWYLCMTVAGILWSFVIDDTRPLADASGMALVWSWYNIILLLLACFVAVEAFDRRVGERFAVNRMGVVSTQDRRGNFLIADISVTGMRLVAIRLRSRASPSACNMKISTSRRWSCEPIRAASRSASCRTRKFARS
jgi:cellulose synthase (UDP-forming)